MNLFKLSILLVLIVTFSACGDDDTSCEQADWIGTYAGTVDCDGVVEDVTVTITASGTDAIIIMYATDNSSTEFEAINLDGCDLDKSESAGGFSVSIEASLDGDKLSVKDEISVGGDTATCEVTATRN